jgi:hypothetical protein
MDSMFAFIEFVGLCGINHNFTSRKVIVSTKLWLIVVME